MPRATRSIRTRRRRCRSGIPLRRSAKEIQAWRRLLSEHQITQPFKQAHREVYLLTDAELETGTYSNRFAAHVLKQHQMAALMKQRGWKYELQGAWDSHNVPTLRLERFSLAAEFWLEAVALEDTSPAGIFLYLSSDQLCFRRGDHDDRLALTEVPALVFSEVMRDADLFVSVASIGADETWSDERRNDWHDYVDHFQFGALRPTGETRREILAEIIPALQISERLRLEERWLHVEGDLGSYRIHLGSGGVQRDPGGHLCIVEDLSPSKRTRSQVALPFEGDQILSLILSKALLLANDKKIKDPTILSQLRGSGGG